MKGQSIPDSEHVARYCKASTIENSAVQATAFMLRTGEEYLSVNWLENLDCPDRERNKCIAESLLKKIEPRRDYRPYCDFKRWRFPR
jgi:hypothetical protein